METIFLILVVVLAILAISDLIVGVSNDAVNFINSAIGSKAATFRVVMIVAALGVFFGAAFSGGMMEVARKGIFHPEYFHFYDVMVIFLAVMITDVVLLDLFNTYGLPTSTTVSVVFELLGGAVAVSLIKLAQGEQIIITEGGQKIAELADYINSDKALAIISGILLSVVVSFTVGMIVQYISRLLFSFNFKKRMKYFGGIFGGIAIATITHFILVKGIHGASFGTYEVSEGVQLQDWIKENSMSILIYGMIGWTIVLQLLQMLFKLNILKMIVLVGTFGLALAFAGNDLVNFIGVPMAGYKAFQSYIASGAADPNNFLMVDLAAKSAAPTLFLILAGLIMVLTLFISKKAKNVVKTSLNLSRQNEGYERFGSSAFARSLVRGTLGISKGLQFIVPDRVNRFINRQFDQSSFKKEIENDADAPVFDLLRASVNLVVASVLISIATANKLPLSTTYVTFMVAMGTSLADRAWGVDSAVYRITGVVSVIGGWFFTAISAFTASFVVAFLIWHGGLWAIAGFVLLAGFFILRTHVLYKRKEKKNIVDEASRSMKTELKYDNIMKSCSANVNSILSQVSENYIKTLDGIMDENRKQLREAVKDVEEVNEETKRLKDNISTTIKRLNEDSIHNGHYYVQVLDYLRETAHCLTYIAKPGLSHVDNNHKGLIGSQKDDINLVKGRVLNVLEKIMHIIAEARFESVGDLIKEQQSVIEQIEEIRKKQIKRIKNEETGTKNSMLFLGIMHETKNLLLYGINLVKAHRDFYKAIGEK